MPLPRLPLPSGYIENLQAIIDINLKMADYTQGQTQYSDVLAALKQPEVIAAFSKMVISSTQPEQTINNENILKGLVRLVYSRNFDDSTHTSFVLPVGMEAFINTHKAQLIQDLNIEQAREEVILELEGIFQLKEVFKGPPILPMSDIANKERSPKRHNSQTEKPGDDTEPTVTETSETQGDLQLKPTTPRKLSIT